MKLAKNVWARVPGRSRAPAQGSGQTSNGAGLPRISRPVPSTGVKGQATTRSRPNGPLHAERGRTARSEKPKPATKKKRGPQGSKSGTSTLNILQFNTSGLKNRKTELAKLACDKSIHVILLQETEHRTTNSQLNGYTSYECKCTSCRGILTYIRNDVTGDVMHLPSGNTDIQKVTIWWNKKEYTILNVYSPPWDNCSIPILEDTYYTRTIVCGDFNGHSPRWGYSDHNKSGKYVEKLADTTNLMLVQNANSTPTLLHRAHKTLHRPDLTLISADLTDTATTHVDDDMGSDHRALITKIHSPEPAQHTNKTKWNFFKADWKLFRETSDTLLDIEPPMQVNEANKVFTEAVEKASLKSIPRGSRKKYKPFWSKEMETAVNERRKARKQLEKSNSPTDKTEYNKATAFVKRTTLKAKREKWHKTCNKLDLRSQGTKAWKLLNNLSGKKQRSNPKPMSSDNEKAVTDRQRAETINRHFAKVNKAKDQTSFDRVLLKNLQKMERRKRPSTPTFDDHFTAPELAAVLHSLPDKKAPGPDAIHNEMLKNLGQKGRTYLLKLINTTWTMGELPTSWKTATVTPILKQGKDAADPNGYRPISLTSCVGKVAEKMVNKRLYWWLETNEKLAEQQAGFRKNSRTEDCIFHLTQEIHDGFQENKHTAAIFIDLQKAYDQVWRKGLLYKMQKQEINGRLYWWIKNFLTNRTMATKINNSTSKKVSIEDGLPQGSALSCTLFLIFINDVTEVLQAHHALFADDIVLWHTSRYPIMCRRRLSEDLKRLWIYCQMWKLQVNASKTKYSIFTMSPKTAKCKLKLTYGNSELEKEENPVYLGIHFDTTLTFGVHVEETVKKATNRLNLLKRLGSTTWGADKITLRNLYLGYIRSVLEYNAAILYTCSKTNQDQLDKVQRRALRFVCGGIKTSPNAACEIDSNVMPLQKRREQAVLQAVERYKRMPENHPTRSAIKNWKKKSRIKQRSLLDKYSVLKENQDLPEDRVQMCRVEEPPYAQFMKPKIMMSLADPKITKESDPTLLKTTTLETIDSYGDDNIRIYTDGSAFKATLNAGFGSWIRFPNGEEIEISEPCGEICSNYEAELIAIAEALKTVNRTFCDHPSRVQNIVLFTDSMSSLQTLESGNPDFKEAKLVRDTIHSLITNHKINITMQWVPGHSEIRGNDKADKLAKAGARKPQPQKATTFRTVKQIIKSNCKIEWMNAWALDHTGRTFFKYRPTSSMKDNALKLSRREQSAIFRLRTGHATLNYHLNTFMPHHPPNCDLCDHPYETVEHHLFKCRALNDIRTSLLPPTPNLESCLYSSLEQLRNTCQFHFMAMSRRAKARRLLDQ